MWSISYGRGVAAVGRGGEFLGISRVNRRFGNNNNDDDDVNDGW